MDRPVVKEEGIRDIAQLRQCRVVVDYDRFAAEVPGSHHQRPVVNDQVVQWRIREHESYHVVTRRHTLRKITVRAFPQQHDRPLAAGYQGRFVHVEVGKPTRAG